MEENKDPLHNPGPTCTCDFCKDNKQGAYSIDTVLPGRFDTPFLEAAMALHEMFITLLDAGFTEIQALYITSDMLRNSGKGGE